MRITNNNLCPSTSTSFLSLFLFLNLYFIYNNYYFLLFFIRRLERLIEELMKLFREVLDTRNKSATSKDGMAQILQLSSYRYAASLTSKLIKVRKKNRFKKNNIKEAIK